MEINVKNDYMLGRKNDGMIATKLYSLEKIKEDYESRFNKIKEYLKQVHIEQQNGILSSNNLIWENITRLCDGLEILGVEE